MKNQKKIKEFAKACGKKVAEVIYFPATGTFEAFRKAEEVVGDLGYTIGRMCMDKPIPFAKNVSYIAKWFNIAPEDRNRIEGGLISSDFREGAVSLVIFE